MLKAMAFMARIGHADNIFFKVVDSSFDIFTPHITLLHRVKYNTVILLCQALWFDFSSNIIYFVNFCQKVSKIVDINNFLNIIKVKNWVR